MPASVWVVSPVYRDVESYLLLRSTLIRTLASIPALRGWSVSFLTVDDTAGADPEIAKLLGLTDVTVLRPPFNLGHQRALVFGLRHLEQRIGSADIVVTLDADGEDRPEDLPGLVSVLLSPGNDERTVVLARRTSRDVTLAFRLMHLCFALMFRLLTGKLIRTGNYACYRGWLVKQVIFHPHFDLCYSTGLLSLDLHVHLVDCPRGRRYAGRSRMGYFKLIRHGMSMLMPFLDRIALRALIVFVGTLGLGAAAVAAMALLAVVRGRMLPESLVTGILVAVLFSFMSMGHFVILFALYAQSQSTALRSLERSRERQAS